MKHNYRDSKGRFAQRTTQDNNQDSVTKEQLTNLHDAIKNHTNPVLSNNHLGIDEQTFTNFAGEKNIKFLSLRPNEKHYIHVTTSVLPYMHQCDFGTIHLNTKRFLIRVLDKEDYTWKLLNCPWSLMKQIEKRVEEYVPPVPLKLTIIQRFKAKIKNVFVKSTEDVSTNNDAQYDGALSMAIIKEHYKNGRHPEYKVI